MQEKYSISEINKISTAPSPRVLLNVGTHGTEKIGLRVADKIKELKLKKGSLFINVANEKALKQGKRFIMHDLNRVFPGKKNGSPEEHLAYLMTPYIKAFDVVIDIHSTETLLRSTIITTTMNKTLKRLIRAICPKRVVIMKATKSNALISRAKIGIAFEYGSDKSEKTLSDTVIGVKRLLGELGMITSKNKLKKEIEFYTAYAGTPKPKDAIPNLKIKNYSRVNIGDILGYEKSTRKPILSKRAFYPVLYGKNSYQSIFGFEAKKEVVN